MGYICTGCPVAGSIITYCIIGCPTGYIIYYPVEGSIITGCIIGYAIGYIMGCY